MYTYGLLDLICSVEVTATEESVGYFAAQNLAAAGSQASGARSCCTNEVQDSLVVVIGVPELTATRPRKRME